VDLTEPASDAIRRSVFDLLPDGIAIVDLDGRIAYANEQLSQMSGYAREELLGLPVDELVPDAQRAQHHIHRESYVAAGLPARAMGTNLRTRLRTKQNLELPFACAKDGTDRFVPGGGSRIDHGFRPTV